MTVRYLLCPGKITSRTDGDQHYIDGRQLAHLHRLNPADCEVMPSGDSHEDSLRRVFLRTRVSAGELIPLYPRYDGNYLLPDSTVNTVSQQGTTMTNQDKLLEALIQSKDPSGPRVSLADLEANIAHIEYVRHVSVSGQVLRWCVITTTSGYAVTGDPSCAASAVNDNQELGEARALEAAKRNLWPLMAYALRESL